MGNVHVPLTKTMLQHTVQRINNNTCTQKSPARERGKEIEREGERAKESKESERGLIGEKKVNCAYLLRTECSQKCKAPECRFSC